MQPKELSNILSDDIEDSKIWPLSSQRLRQRHCQSIFMERFTNISLLIVLLIATNAASWFLAQRLSCGSVTSQSEQPSRYAGLLKNKVEPFVDPESPFASTTNDTATFILWQSLQTDFGAIAVPDSVSQSWHLPPAQPFPWDQSKSLFQLHGYHSLHCVKNIAITLYQLKHNLPLSREWGHVMHCVDTIRRDVMCQADDTPRYTAKTGKGIGPGQTRQCRDWEKLEEWAKGYHSCFRAARGNSRPLIESFKFCPKGSPYRDQVARIWGDDFIKSLDRDDT